MAGASDTKTCCTYATHRWIISTLLALQEMPHQTWRGKRDTATAQPPPVSEPDTSGFPVPRRDGSRRAAFENHGNANGVAKFPWKQRTRSLYSAAAHTKARQCEGKFHKTVGEHVYAACVPESWPRSQCHATFSAGSFAHCWAYGCVKARKKQHGGECLDRARTFYRNCRKSHPPQSTKFSGLPFPTTRPRWPMTGHVVPEPRPASTPRSGRTPE